jgi:hypothetical protein
VNFMSAFDAGPLIQSRRLRNSKPRGSISLSVEGCFDMRDLGRCSITRSPCPITLTRPRWACDLPEQSARVALSDVRSASTLRTQSRTLRRVRNPQQKRKSPRYSIIASARASSVGGTVRPRAFAVLRLITNSSFSGAWTGNSLGFSPLRMRSA